jgi:hypothetical protein
MLQYWFSFDGRKNSKNASNVVTYDNMMYPKMQVHTPPFVAAFPFDGMTSSRPARTILFQFDFRCVFSPIKLLRVRIIDRNQLNRHYSVLENQIIH